MTAESPRGFPKLAEGESCGYAIADRLEGGGSARIEDGTLHSELRSTALR